MRMVALVQRGRESLHAIRSSACIKCTSKALLSLSSPFKIWRVRFDETLWPWMLCEEDFPPNMMSELMEQNQNRKSHDVFDPAVATNDTIT